MYRSQKKNYSKKRKASARGAHDSNLNSSTSLGGIQQSPHYSLQENISDSQNQRMLSSNTSDLQQCPRCLTYVKDLAKHYAQKNICAIASSNDQSLVTTLRHASSYSRQKTEKKTNTSNVTSIHYSGLNDIDEDMFVLHDDISVHDCISKNTKIRETEFNHRVATSNSTANHPSANHNRPSISMRDLIKTSSIPTLEPRNLLTPQEHPQQFHESTTSAGSKSTMNASTILNHSTALNSQHVSDIVHTLQSIQRTDSDDIDINRIAHDQSEHSPNFDEIHNNFKDDNVQVLLYKHNEDYFKTNSNVSFAVLEENNNDDKNNDNNNDNKNNNRVSIGNHCSTVTTYATQATDTSTTTTSTECYRFVYAQEYLDKLHTDLNIDPSLVSRIRLLHLMYKGNIAATHYSDILCWHKDTMLEYMSGMFHTISQATNMPKKVDNVLAECHRIIFGKLLPQYTMKPIHSVIQLPSRKFCRISNFDFRSMFLSLLMDYQLTSSSNMLLENKYYLHPELFSNLGDEEKYYGDIYTGSWFLKAHKKICRPHTSDILCPIILFIDGTPIDAFGNLKLESVMFTLGMFNRETRNKNQAWRLLGYIPDTTYDCVTQDAILDNSDSDDDDHEFLTNDEQVEKRQDYHHMLRHILKGIIEAEKSPGIMWKYTKADGTVVMFNLRVTLMFVIGDALGNDKLCDRFLSYRSSTGFLCRDCNCPSSKLADVDFPCAFTRRSTIKSMSSREARRKCYYKIGNNAFDYMIMGFDEYGINGLSPSEFLHQFLLGVLKDLNETFFNSITSKGLQILDRVAKYIALNWHRQSDKDMPNLQPFKEGIQKKHLTGDEVLSQTFMIYLSLVQSYSMEEFVKVERSGKPRYKTKSHIEVRNSVDPNTPAKKTIVKEKVYYEKVGKSIGHVKKWLRLFEASLAFYAWLKQEKIPYLDLKLSRDVDNPLMSNFNSKVDVAIRNYLKLYYSIVKAPGGATVMKMKPHQTKHIPHQIRRLGSPMNYDGGIGERHLKHITKNPARQTQKRSSLLAQQAAERYSERLTVNFVYDLMIQNGVIDETRAPSTFNFEGEIPGVHNRQIENDSPDYYSISGRYVYHFDDNGKYTNVTWDKRKNRLNSHSPSLLEEIYARLRQEDYQIDCNYLSCFTVLKVVVDKKECLFRADPYFYKKQWNDWCIASWDGQGDYPARIFMFIDPTKMSFKQDVVSNVGQYLAIVKSTKDDPRRRSENRFDKDSCLFKSYGLENTIRIISCQSICRNAFVCPDISANARGNSTTLSANTDSSAFKVNHVISFKPYSTWAKAFIDCNWCD